MNLSEIRKRVNLDRVEFAKKLNINVIELEELENNDDYIPFSIMRDVYDLWGISPITIVLGETKINKNIEYLLRSSRNLNFYEHIQNMHYDGSLQNSEKIAR